MASTTTSVTSGRTLRSRQPRQSSTSNSAPAADCDRWSGDRSRSGCWAWYRWREEPPYHHEAISSAQNDVGGGESYVLTSIGAPKLDRVAHEYGEAVRAQCKNTGGDPNSLMVSLRNSFDEAYLDTLCEIEWRMSKENLTDDFLWQWIKSEVETFKNETMPDIEGLFQKELKFASLFNGNDEKKCKILVKCLPEKLKKRVKNEIDFGKDGNPKRDVPALYQLILRMALEQAKEDQVLP
ncbi:hypothetical protein P43SY_009982 [Pythium insidiosum]|uniref:Uncharacterized protein n=1 Tax=Pythium insidiosum TaxID=114742 RepID=A0AAD5Q3R8_PYTIN|nr:hypothetical protein P43SY_009982 [Pythium insidiosum]